jgi:hypothetical protein
MSLMARVGWLATAVLAASCVTVSKTVLTEEYLNAPVPPGDVNVLMALMGDTIPTECARVAILHASGDEDLTDEGDFLERLREEAGELGANTVFVQTMEDPGTGERIVGHVLGTTSDRDSDALALHCPPR